MVDQAYWHLAKLYNDAAESDPSARVKLEALNEAYTVLRSPGLRKVYDKVRELVLRPGAEPAVSQPDPPLAVMAKHRPAPLEGTKPARISVKQLTIPAWQNLLTALVVLALSGAALAAGANPTLVFVLLFVGLAFSTLRLARELHVPALSAPTVRLPPLRGPRLPERRPRGPAVEPDQLRESTEAILARWREVAEAYPSAARAPAPRAEPEPAREEEPTAA